MRYVENHFRLPSCLASLGFNKPFQRYVKDPSDKHDPCVELAPEFTYQRVPYKKPINASASEAVDAGPYLRSFSAGLIPPLCKVLLTVFLQAKTLSDDSDAKRLSNIRQHQWTPLSA